MEREGGASQVIHGKSTKTVPRPAFAGLGTLNKTATPVAKYMEHCPIDRLRLMGLRKP